MRYIGTQQREAIQAFLEHAEQTAKKCFNRDGCCTPVALFLLSENEQSAIPLAEIINHKDLAAALLNRLIEEAKPLAFAFVVETWFAKEADRKGGGSLLETFGEGLTEEAPDGNRQAKAGVKEAVMVQASSVAGDNYTLLAEIVRPQNGKPALKAWERMDNKESVGRFVFNVTPLHERQ